MKLKAVLSFVLVLCIAIGVFSVAFAGSGHLCPDCDQYTVEVFCGSSRKFVGPSTNTCGQQEGCLYAVDWYKLGGSCTNCGYYTNSYNGMYHAHFEIHNICGNLYKCVY